MPLLRVLLRMCTCVLELKALGEAESDILFIQVSCMGMYVCARGSKPRPARSGVPAVPCCVGLQTSW